jgi:hypothetical protein
MKNIIGLKHIFVKKLAYNKIALNYISISLGGMVDAIILKIIL